MLRILAAALALAAGMGNAQQAAPRYALVIGNAAYTTPGWRLVNPVNDATLMATRLRGLGFSVTPLMNATRAQMEVAMSAFTTSVRAGGADAVGVFYYAGHGVEVDGANLLVPVDVTARSMDELRYQAPPMQFLLRDLARAGNKVNIIVLDACRNLPLPLGSRAGPAGGLADLADVPDNVLIAYATRPGLTAPDNPGATNSVFTRTLAKALADNPSETAVNLFASVQAQVYSETNALQRPEFRSGLLRAADWRFASPADGESEVDRLRRQNAALKDQFARHREWSTLPGAEGLQAPPASPAPASATGSATGSAARPTETGGTERRAPGAVFRDCADVCPEMVAIPAGQFTMGDDNSMYDNERPAHVVAVQAFAAGRYEVTRGEWKAFVAATRRANPPDDCFTTSNRKGSWRAPGFAQDDRHPVVCASWDDAQAYVAWLTQKTGHTYRLLTEAEWEYAARAATTTAYWFGDAISARNANYRDTGAQATVRVGSYAANGFGLYDTAGNAWEWTADCEAAGYVGAPTDGSAAAGASCAHVDRGGSWLTDASYLRSARRNGNSNIDRTNTLGFRVARAAP